MTNITCYVLVILYCVLSVAYTQFADRKQFLDFHNFGYVLQKVQTIKVVNAEAKILFHFQLPLPFNTTVKAINCNLMVVNGDNSQAELCQQMMPFIREMQGLRVKTLTQLEQHLKWIYDVLENYDPPIRSKRGLWSGFWSSVTGLAESSDIDKLRFRLRSIESGVNNAAEAWRTGSSHYVAALEAEKKRVDSINRLMRLERQSIKAVQEDVILATRRDEARFNQLGHMLSQYISPMVFELVDIEDLYNSVQILHNGRIPYRFVSHRKLREGLRVLKQQLKLHHSDLVVAVENLNYYYKNPDFHVFRYSRQLIISLHVPLTLKSLLNPLNFVKFQKIPIINPHENTHYTKLTYNFKWIAFSLDEPFFLTFRDFPRLRNDLFLDLRYSESKLRKMNQISCTTALIRGSLTDIKRLCKYTIFPRPLPPSVYQLSDTAILLSNISDVTIMCHNESVTVRHDVIQFVYNTHCGCSLTTQDFYIPFTSLNCMRNLNASIEVSHILNLPYLSEFLHYDIVKELKADLFLNRTLEAKLPELPIASAEFERDLKLEEETSLDLQTAINQSKSDTQIYKSLSHYIYNRMIQNQSMQSDFDIFNIFSWLTLAGIILGTLGFLWAALLHLRYRALYMLTLTRFPTTTALPTFPWEVVFTKSTTTASSKEYDFYDIQQQLIKILPVDLTLLFLVAVCVSGYLAYLVVQRCKNRSKNKTFFFIQVCDEEDSVSWLLTSLPYLPAHYKVEASTSISLTLTRNYFTATLSFSEALKVICKPLASEVAVLRELVIYPWKIFKARKILNNKHYIALLVYDQTTLIDVALLRKWREMQNQDSSHLPVDTSKMPTSEQNQLYPVI